MKLKRKKQKVLKKWGRKKTERGKARDEIKKRKKKVAGDEANENQSWHMSDAWTKSQDEDEWSNTKIFDDNIENDVDTKSSRTDVR